MREQDFSPVSRRDLLKSAAAGGLALALTTGGETVAAADTSVSPSAAAPAAAPAGAAAAANGPSDVSGVVFEDRVGDGIRRADSPGLPGVLVSNGREVVATDASGRYSLPVGRETIVFVIKPAGFAPPLDPETKLAKFYYVHQPDGSPASLGLTFAGLAPTGPLPEGIDFPLIRQEEARSFDVLLMTDPQPETEAELDFVRDDLTSVFGAALSGGRVKFGITVGDMLFDDLSMYPRYNKIIGALGLPWYNVGGNHDLNFEAPDRHYARETFKRVFGPTYYAFGYGEAFFVVLDDVDYLGYDKSKPNGSGKYQGKLDAVQLEFLRNFLSFVPQDKLVVLALHIPLKTALDDEPYQNLINRADLLGLLAGRPHTLSLSGHTHTTEHHYFDAALGFSGPAPHHHHVLTALSGSWWSGPFDHRGVAVADSRDGTPNGFHILSIDGAAYTTRYVPAKEPEARQMRVSLHAHAHDEMRRDFRPGALLQPRVDRAAAASAVLVANVFDGGPKTSVSAVFGQGSAAKTVAMQRKAMPDPFVEEVFARNEASKKPWVKAEVCSHLWAVRLPELGAGAHRLAVTAIDDYGRAVSTQLVLEIEG